ncbi:MAG: ABC transporter permease [Bacteroidales bacterium]|nr:ABC transporter permease [Clostridium sp.]MCM1204098.1 ABC transporter permease [Bacteroidales bacterium]
MMLFKLSVKNIRKSIKDYTIYFLTLILAVAIFYMFNSLDSQQAMLVMSSSTRTVVELMVDLIAGVSVFVAVILGFLIIYANNFLIKRRKKEFGLYMTLGMGKGKISRILLIETVFIGLFSLTVGLLIGIFGSQLMSILVGKLFMADMSEFKFIFSKEALLKTCLYFGIMYVAVMLFNAVTISKCKLIDLLTASRKNEKVKMKNPVLCVAVFLTAVSLLGYAYYKVTGDIESLDTIDKLTGPVLMGCVSTFLIFWSMSGFILRLVQSRKNVYLRGTNLFVLRQIHNKINTTVVSMTIICLLLFMTISVLSSSLSLNNSMTKDLEEMTPVDINLYKTANLPETDEYTKVQIEDSRLSVSDTLKNAGMDMSLLKDVVEINIYATNELTLKDTLGDVCDEIREEYPFFPYDTAQEIVRLSDYNRIAKEYGIPEYELREDEYIILCNYDYIKDNARDRALAAGSKITVAGQEYNSRYKECQPGFIEMSTSHTNSGIILVPDSCKLTDEMKKLHFLSANYNVDTQEEKEKIESIFVNYGENSEDYGENSEVLDKILDSGIQLDGMTKIAIVESSRGVAVIIIFVAIYLGVIFLIASSAILALKELTENSDNKQRYTVLRRIGVDEGMINQALFRQIGIFFLLPLVLAVIHSVFGIQFALKLIALQVKPEDMLPSVIGTAVFLVAVYGGYFLATYTGSKNIIKED